MDGHEEFKSGTPGNNVGLCHWLGSVSILTIWPLTMLHVSIPILSPSSFMPPLYRTYKPSLESNNPHQQISLFVRTWNVHIAHTF